MGCDDATKNVDLGAWGGRLGCDGIVGLRRGTGRSPRLHLRAGSCLSGTSASPRTRTRARGGHRPAGTGRGLPEPAAATARNDRRGASARPVLDRRLLGLGRWAARLAPRPLGASSPRTGLCAAPMGSRWQRLAASRRTLAVTGGASKAPYAHQGSRQSAHHNAITSQVRRAPNTASGYSARPRLPL